ncbi:hypothetical protein [Halobiforma nitratireducens]|uniref:Uncharacterized protein n=1 Tax=Halobiforma nitratireducens JCM 10879 TaxID=1227454 RepID=M0M3S4_9EURY|nr:hypothetical protein [Halobiforma nitratireducens]EMA40043.1 hypothetical protein C446_07729 [Halobiforma nitratireducens JCM 10879]
MFAIVIGLVLTAFGLAGVWYAPAIVEAQRREGMAPLEDSNVEESDRIAVTKGVGAVMIVAGLAVAAYGAGLV